MCPKSFEGRTEQRHRDPLLPQRIPKEGSRLDRSGLLKCEAGMEEILFKGGKKTVTPSSFFHLVKFKLRQTEL